MATFVLVHGAWDGGWAWRSVARILQAAGHEVFTPTLTGSGERVHLASPEVDLTTHIGDIVNVLRYEQLDNVILVGYDYGGMVITGVAEQASEHLRELVYLDAFVPQDGQSVVDLAPPEIIHTLWQAAQTDGDGWRIPHHPTTPDDRRTGALIKAGEQPLPVTNPEAVRLKHAYIHGTGRPEGPMTRLIADRIAKVQNAGWQYREVPYDEFLLLNRPQEVARLLLDLV